MAIIQISKIQQRSGNLVDLPQLDEAQFGWASDAKRLFIGKTTPNENIEVLTAYSNISFSQIDGSGGANYNVTTPVNGQVLTYVADTNTWDNWPRADILSSNANFKLNLGDAGNIKVTGGSTGFVLQTDGLGNLSWTTKGVVVSNISAASQANPGVITTATPHYLVDRSFVTITGANGMTQLNGNSYYANVLTSNTFALYTDSAATTSPVNTTGYGAYTSGGQVVSQAGTGASTLIAGGVDTTIQYNNNGTLTGASALTINPSSVLTHSGPYFAVGNVYANSGAVVSNTLSVVGNATIGNVIGPLASGNSNVSITANANITMYVAGNANARFTATSTGVVTNGTVSATGNITGNNLIGPLASGNSNVSITSNANITMYVAGNANARFTATTTGVVANGTLSASGNANVGNIGATNGIFTNVSGNGSTLSSITGANVTGTVPTANNASYLQGYQVASAATATAIALRDSTGNLYANYLYGNGSTITGTVPSATTAGTVTANAQPNITSHGTLTVLSVSGNANIGNIGTGGLITATGNIYSANLISSSTTGADFNILGATQTTANATGGIINITAGTGNGTGGVGGSLNVTGGAAATGVNADGGAVQIAGGTAQGGGQGGQLTIRSGNSGNANVGLPSTIQLVGGFGSTGGNINLTAGNASSLTNRNGGWITITAGASTGSAGAGKILLQTSTVGASGTTQQTIANRVVISDSTVNIVTSTDSTSTTTGSLVVAGGAGIGGNLNVGGTISATGNVTGNYFIGNGSSLSSIAGANVSGAVAYATIANAVAGANVVGPVARALTADNANTAGTVTGNAQANITSVGSLSSLDITGNVTIANTPIANSLAGSITSGRMLGAYASRNVSSANFFFADYNNSGNITSADALGVLKLGSTLEGIAGLAGLAVKTNYGNNPAGLSFVSGTSSDVGRMSAGNVAGLQYTANVNAVVMGYTGGGPRILVQDYALSDDSPNTITHIATTHKFVGNISTTNITTGANTTAGSLTGNWTLSAGSQLQATYADLAEYYEADSEYEPGTVLAFGGEKEVTIAEDGTTRIAGVVSTNPAYAMNSGCPGIAVAIALQGRVPTKVRGVVRKGDMMISAGDGYARPTSSPVMGTVIGKALENFDGIEGVIEVAVGRL